MGTPRAPDGNRADAHAAVKRELLVRYLDTWTPTVLRSAKRVTFAHGYAGVDAARDVATADPAAVAALRTFGEFTDRLSGRHLAMVLVEQDAARLRALERQLAALHAELGGPDQLTIHYGQGGCDDLLAPTLAATGAAKWPVFAFLDAPVGAAPAYDTIRAVARGPHRELLIVLDAAMLAGLCDGTVPAEAGDRMFGGPGWREVLAQPPDRRYGHLVTAYRQALHDAGLSLTTHLELVGDASGGPETAQLLVFATTEVKHLEKFKDELWAVDEYAGISYRDPHDAEHAVVAISLNPQLAPLRRALLAAAGRRASTVADLRRYALTETMYRAGDANHAIAGLVAAGSLDRDPDKGRLAAETRLTPRG